MLRIFIRNSLHIFLAMFNLKFYTNVSIVSGVRWTRGRQCKREKTQVYVAVAARHKFDFVYLTRWWVDVEGYIIYVCAKLKMLCAGKLTW